MKLAENYTLEKIREIFSSFEEWIKKFLEENPEYDLTTSEESKPNQIGSNRKGITHRSSYNEAQYQILRQMSADFVEYLNDENTLLCCALKLYNLKKTSIGGLYPKKYETEVIFSSLYNNFCRTHEIYQYLDSQMIPLGRNEGLELLSEKFSYMIRIDFLERNRQLGIHYSNENIHICPFKSAIDTQNEFTKRVLEYVEKIENGEINIDELKLNCTEQPPVNITKIDFLD